MSRLQDALVALVVALGGVGALLGVLLLAAAIGSISVYLGWNLGVYGLAHAVHISVLHISYPTAFGGSFVIGVINRIFTHHDGITINRKAPA